MNDPIIKEEYINWVVELKNIIHSSQIKASLSVNKEMLTMYWEIGQSISQKVEVMKWGSSIVEQLSKDLKKLFPNQKGFSRTNLFYMKKWFEFYSINGVEFEKVQQLVGQIPWGQNIVIISKSKDMDEAIFYLNKTVINNWSRTVLIHQMELNLYERQGRAVTNFETTLIEPNSQLAVETLKDPYKFDFLTLEERALEKEIEEQLVQNITSFLLELGRGFAFVGRQVPLEIDNQAFYIDLLFYHIHLKCYIVVELKAVEFKAEYAGKMNLYLSAVDDLIKTENENQTIGLLLCKSKSKIVAEYALRGTTQPIGIAEYELTSAIPDDIKAQLPTIETIEEELELVKKIIEE